MKNADEMALEAKKICESTHKSLDRITTGNFTHNVRNAQVNLALIAGYIDEIGKLCG